MNLFKKAAAVAMSALVVVASIPITGANAAAQKITQYDLTKNNAAINGDGVYRLIGSRNSASVTIESDTTATVTLANLTAATITLGSNANVTFLLSGTSKLDGIYEPESSHITISSAAGDGSTDGSLTCSGGIGGKPGTYGMSDDGQSEGYYSVVWGDTVYATGSHTPATSGGKGLDAYSDGMNCGEITISGGTITSHIGGGNGGSGGSANGGKGFKYDSKGSYSSLPTGNGGAGGTGGKGSNGGNSGLITVTGGKIRGSVGGGAGGNGGTANGGDGATMDGRRGGTGGAGGTSGAGGNGGNCTEIDVTGGEIDGSVGGGAGGLSGSATGGMGGGDESASGGTTGAGGTSGAGGTGGKSDEIEISGGTISGSVGGGNGGSTGDASGGCADTLYTSDGTRRYTGYSTPSNPGTSGLAGNGAEASSITITGGSVTGHVGGGFGGSSGDTNQGSVLLWDFSNFHLSSKPTKQGKCGNSGNGAVCDSVFISGGKVIGTVGSGDAGNVGTSDIWRHESSGNDNYDYLGSDYYDEKTQNWVSAAPTGAKGTDAAFGKVAINGGFIDISKKSIPFTTTLDGKKGNAVVYTSAIPDSVKNDPNTQGVLFEHVTGESYGSRGTVYGTPTIQQDMTLPFRDASGQTNLLAIESGKQLIINQGVTLINRSGSYTQAGGIKIAGKLINQGIIKNAGQINKAGSGTLNKAANSVYQVSAEMHTNYDGSCSGKTDIVNQDVWLTYGQTYLSSLPFLHRTGYSIIGWQDGSGNQMQANAVVDDINPIQLYAKWAKAGCITTTVTDSSTKKAIKDAAVVSKDGNGKIIDTIETDANGKAVTYLEDGSYTTEVTAPGYEKAVSTSAKAVTVSTSATETFALAPIEGGVTITKINKITKKPMPVTGILITNKNGDTVYSGSADSDALSLTVPNLNGPDAPFAVSEMETPKGYRVDMTQYAFTLDKQGQMAAVQMESTPLTGSITIIVTDPATGKPYPAGTEVEVKDDDGNVVGSGKTNEDGSVTIPDVPVGNVHITVPGYDSGDITASVTDGDTTNTTITATPIVGAIKVTNINPATNAALPVPTVTVKDKDGKTVFSGTTEDGMILTIPNLTAISSPYTMTSVALNGYQPDGKTYTVSVTKNGQVSEIELHSVPKTSSATVVITNKDGSTAKNVPVVIKDSTGKVVGSGITDENGHVVIPDLPEGTYTVSVKDKDGNAIDTGKTLTVSVGGTNTVTAVDGNQTHGSVAVSFTDPVTGKPVAGIDVEVKDKDGKVVAEGSTDENGNVHFPNLPEGDYTVVTKDKDGNEIGSGQKISVTGGSSASTAIKNPAQVGGTTITMTDPVTGKPAANVSVVLKDKNGNVIAEGTTDTNGKVTFTDVAEGSYTAVVKDKDGKEIGEGQPVTIEGGKTANVAMTDASKIGNVDMTITDPATGKPLPNADVFLKDKDGKIIATGKTDENGHVVFKDVPVGNYTVTVSDSSGKTVIDGNDVAVAGGKSSTVTLGKPESSSSSSASSSSSSSSASSRPSSSSAPVVNPPASSSSSSSSSSVAGKADITAKDDSGNPLSNIPVVIKDSTGKTVGTGTTDSNGKVTVPNLPDGTYTISSGDSSVTLEGSITISSGKTSSVTLKGSRVPTGNAKLLVVDTHQQPLKNFTLLVMRADSPAANSSMIPLRKSGTIVNSVSSENNQVVAEVTTDANGYVILPQLDAGQYILIAKDSSEYKVDSSLAIVPSTTVSATVTATPISTSSSKQPAASASTVSGSGTKAPAASNNNQPTAETPVESSASVPSDYTVPKTGQSGIIPAIVLVLMAVCGTAGVLFSRKKRK